MGTPRLTTMMQVKVIVKIALIWEPCAWHRKQEKISPLKATHENAEAENENKLRQWMSTLDQKWYNTSSNETVPLTNRNEQVRLPCSYVATLGCWVMWESLMLSDVGCWVMLSHRCRLKYQSLAALMLKGLKAVVCMRKCTMVFAILMRYAYPSFCITQVWPVKETLVV